MSILRTDPFTPDNYAHYWRTTNDPPYFSSSTGAGNYVNFFNVNDYALGMWNMDQNLKPDLWINYGYDGTNYFQGLTFPNVARLLLLPIDTYEIFAYCDQAPCYALGATPNVGGTFNLSAQQNLVALWPADVHPGHDYSAHVWHSAQFRSDNMSQNAYWNQIMRTFQLLPAL